METTAHILLSAIKSGRPPSDKATRRDFGFAKCKDALQEGYLLDFYDCYLDKIGVWEGNDACRLSEWQKSGRLFEQLNVPSESLRPGPLNNPQAEIVKTLDDDIHNNPEKGEEGGVEEENLLIDLSEPQTEGYHSFNASFTSEVEREDDEETRLGVEDDEVTNPKADTKNHHEKTYEFGLACLCAVRARKAFAVAVAVHERAQQEVERTEKELENAEREEAELRRKLLE